MTETLERKFKELGITSKSGIQPEYLVGKLEEEYSVRLPSLYRFFLVNYGSLNFSCDITYNSVEQHPSMGDRSIVNFYELQENANGIKESIDCYLGRLPENLIPIAECPGGDQLCIGIRDVEDKVYFWNHDQEMMFPSIDELWNNIYLVADSFLDFIVSFKIIEHEEGTESNLSGIKMSEIRMSDKFKELLNRKQ